MKWIQVLALSTISLVAFPAITNAGQLQNRLNNQERRIYNGVQSGELTRHEYRKLERQQDILEAKRRKQAIDGGGLTAKESVRLNRQLDQQSRRIYQQKHD